MASCLVCGPFQAASDAEQVKRGTSVADLQADAGVAQDIRTLREMLTRKIQMMDAVKMHQSAMEVAMQELGDQVECARYALDDLASKFQIQDTSETSAGNDEKACEILLTEAHDAGIEAASTTHQRAASPPSTAEVPVGVADVEKISVDTQSSDHDNPKTLLSKLQSQMQTPVVSLPNMDLGLWSFIRAWCRILVDEKALIGRCFEFTVCAVIVVNSILIGIESELSLSGDTSSWSRPLEITFLIIYTLEVVVRLIAKGWRCFQDRWFQFDFVLVVVTILGQSIASLSEQVANAMQQVLVLRAIRLLRLIRAFKAIKQLRTVWRLVYGLITSGETMLSTLALLGLVIYVFAVIGLESIAKDTEIIADAATNKIVEDHFSSLYVSMITLSQFVTSDSIAAIYLPLMKKKPELTIYFLLLMIIVSISLMNLVTAVIVEGALEHARQDREEEQKLLTASAKNMLTEISDLFKGLDHDNNEMLSVSEVQRAEFEKKVAVPSHILDKASVDSMTELFAKLDIDHSGILTREEFTEGLLNIFLLDIPVADMQVMKMVRMLRTGVQKIEADLAMLKRVVCESNMPTPPQK
ncbi:Scn1a [Symbiodinium natans]|uniref:Scn1a protein n=1 Tax=Symbiodinium natans TaxID=878477 RepID=A0A812RTA9_9DINO|nr:Scn1a [Symbiodinium natans]